MISEFNINFLNSNSILNFIHFRKDNLNPKESALIP